MNRQPWILFILLTLATAVYGQREPGYDNVVVPQTRIDLRDLGYSPVDLIPNGDSAITSLALAPNGDVYGATSGAHSYLFTINNPFKISAFVHIENNNG